MILRVVRGRIRPGELNAVAASYRRDFLPVAEHAAGLDRFIVAARADPDGGHSLAALTLWTTIESALEAYAGNLGAVRTLDDVDHGEELGLVDYYEVDTSEARRRPGTPSILRLTAGRVARGLDAEIQQELRRNLPSLPDEVLAAYVGRRVLGVEVEIAFASAWSAVPDGVSLEAPVWPAISDRYASFVVDVMDILLEGRGAG